ncbi:MAG: hypothetical protein ACI4Q6_01075, partial [Huintestinicola sp.]
MLTIDGKNIEDFSDVSVIREISGIGTSGISISQLTFSVPDGIIASRAAQVTFSGTGFSLPVYYVSQRSSSNGKTTFTCLDRLAFADETITLSEPTGKEPIINSDTVSTSELLNRCVSVCGFVGYSCSIPPWLTSMKKTSVEGTSYSQLLDKLANVLCGCWYVDDYNYLVFLPFAVSHGAIEVTEHTALNRGINYQVKGLRVVNGADTWEKGSTTYSYDTIQINSDLATEDTAEYIWENMANKELDSVKCQTAIIPYVP